MSGIIRRHDLDRARLDALGLEADPRTVSFMQCTNDCIKMLSLDGRIVYMSHNGLCAMEIGGLDAVQGKIWWDLWPPEHQALLREAVDIARTGEIANFVADCPTAAGNPARWDVTLIAVPDKNGAPHEILCVSRKLTDAG